MVLMKIVILLLIRIFISTIKSFLLISCITGVAFLELVLSDTSAGASDHEKPHMKWSTLWLHTSIMCGREFLYAVEIVLVTPIILQLGMPEKYYSFMWCFSPIIGILVGPILGSQSDRCMSRFGRRRPFIVGLVIGAIIGLTLLIFSKDIAAALSAPDKENQRLWGTIIGVLGAQTMDFCLDQTETPLRAYTLDVCSAQDQPKAFVLQTVFIGVGGALGFIIDGIDWENTFPSGSVASQIKVVYIFAVVIYITTTICNLISIKETPWVKVKTATPTASNSAKFIASHLPPVRKSKSAQNNVQTESECSINNTNPEKCDNFTPKIVVSSCPNTGEHVLQEHLPYNQRPLSLLSRISMSKGLYISTSCPGGLNKRTQSNSESTSSLVTKDSAYGEDSAMATSSNDSLKTDDISTSFPSLLTKENRTSDVGGSLLNLLRNKQFSIKNSIADPTQNNDFILNKNIDTDLNSNKTWTLNGNHTENMKEEKLNDKESSTRAEEKVCATNDQVETLLPNKNSTKHNCKSIKDHSSKELKQERPVTLRQLWLSILTMPSELRWLCAVQFFGFVGMETFLLWYTDLMGRIVYHGDPKALSNSTELADYNTGVKMGCWGLTIYAVAMIIFPVVLERFHLLTKISMRFLYSSVFLLGTVVMIIMFFFTNKWVMLILNSCIGVTFATMLTLPYVLVGKYHQNKMYVLTSPGNTSRGFGLDCAILACQMYAGNIASAAISSPIIDRFETCKAMLLTTGACFLLAFLFAFFLVTYPDKNRTCCGTSKKRTMDDDTVAV
ncbi:unnamed protein product [Clavelina lepadiformis]|uniref:Solute carrier family 45 member 3 n=1 Tax=Clavelina lepadiformis TaxID=159417 RepID=A0ABP0GP26_CLALP